MIFFNENEPEAIEEGLESFLEGFLEARKKDFLRLQGLYSTQDYVSMGKIIHSWKGFCSPYGFGHLGQMAKHLESFLKNKEQEMIVQCLSQMEHYLNHKDIHELHRKSSNSVSE